MQEHNSTTGGAAFDGARQTLHITDVQVTDPAVLAELPRWTNGVRGPLVDADALTTADFTPFVTTALATFARIVPLVSDDQSVRSLETAVNDLGRQAAEAVSTAATTTREASERSQREMSLATESAVKAVAATTRQMRDGTREIVATMVAEVTKLVAGEDAPAARHVQAAVTAAGEKLSIALEQRFTRGLGEIERKFDLRDATSPMGQLAAVVQTALENTATVTASGQQQITEKVEALTQTVAAATAAAQATAKTTAVTPLKGRPFEAALHDIVDSLAGEMGDAYENTADTVGTISRCKKGDGLVTIATSGDDTGAARLLIEMHNADASGRNWPSYFDEAERNRGACVSLGIVRTADQVPGGAAIRIWGSRRIVFAFDPEIDDPALLRTVLLLLRTQALVASSRRGSDQMQIAETELRDALEQVTQLLELQKVAGRVREHADKLHGGLSGVHAKVVRSIEIALAALHGASDDTAAA